jgi:hypothetical protein
MQIVDGLKVVLQGGGAHLTDQSRWIGPLVFVHRVLRGARRGPEHPRILLRSAVIRCPLAISAEDLGRVSRRPGRSPPVGSMIQTMLSVSLVIGVSLLLGFRPTTDPAGWIAAIAVLALLAFALTWLAVALGLVTKTAEAASNVVMPLFLLPFISSAFVPLGHDAHRCPLVRSVPALHVDHRHAQGAAGGCTDRQQRRHRHPLVCRHRVGRVSVGSDRVQPRPRPRIHVRRTMGDRAAPPVQGVAHRACLARRPVGSDVQQMLREPKGSRQRDQVAAGQHVRLDAEPIQGQGPLKLDGVEPVVRTDHDTNRDGRPCLKAADRLEDRVGLGALVRLSLGSDLRPDVCRK